MSKLSTTLIDGKKECSHCHEWKTLDEFAKLKTAILGVRSQCNVCVAGYAQKRWKSFSRAEQTAKNRKNALKINFGMSEKDYQKLLDGQNGGCAICGTKDNGMVGNTHKRLSVDHDHATDKVRGLLCSRCNSAIGLLDESKEKLANAIKYLEATTWQMKR